MYNNGDTKKIIIFLGGDSMLKERLYDETNSEVEKFELVMGYVEGYDEENIQKKNEYEELDKFNSLYYEIAQKVFEEDGTFVTALIKKARVVYPGCPRGEEVYIIEGSRNSYFTPDPQRYKNAVNRVARILAAELNQTTFSITWNDVNYNYFKKE